MSTRDLAVVRGWLFAGLSLVAVCSATSALAFSAMRFDGDASSSTGLRALGPIALALAVVVAATAARRVLRSVHALDARHHSSLDELRRRSARRLKSLERQANALDDCERAIARLLDSSREINDRASSVAEVARKTSDEASAGEHAVSEGRQAVAAIERHMERIVGHMLELGRMSQRASGILDVTNELAEQTNVLAINATIEASGAGEAGQRFAAVAEEIRKLADRVGGSTREIRDLVDDIQAASNTTVMATESGAKAVGDGIARFGEVAEAFERISGGIATTRRAVGMIGETSRSQSSLVDIVARQVSESARSALESIKLRGPSSRRANASIAAADSSVALDDSSIALGDAPIALGDSSIALGDSSIDLSDSAIALGDSSTGTSRSSSRNGGSVRAGR